MLQVEGERTFSPVEPEEVRRKPFHGRVVATSEITAARTLDLDHVRAEVGEMASAEWSRHRLFERQHAYSRERPRRVDAGVIILGADHGAANPPVQFHGSDPAS